MSSEPREYLRHILAEADFLIRRSKGLTFAEFEADETLSRAFARSLGVIGEAAKQVPAEFRARHPDVDWRAMAGMRDRLVHAYFAVDAQIVWEVITERMPELRGQIASILEPE